MKKRASSLTRKTVGLILPHEITIGLSKAKFIVQEGCVNVGELQVSQGSIVWFPRFGKLGLRMRRGRDFVRAATSYAKFAVGGKAQARKNLGRLASISQIWYNSTRERNGCDIKAACDSAWRDKNASV